MQLQHVGHRLLHAVEVGVLVEHAVLRRPRRWCRCRRRCRRPACCRPGRPSSNAPSMRPISWSVYSTKAANTSAWCANRRFSSAESLSQSLIASGFGASFVPGGTMPSSICRARVSSRSLSQPWSNLPFQRAIHSFGHVVRRVRGARREVDEERLVGRQRLLVLDPGHRLVRHVGHEVVVRVVRQLDLGDAVVEVGRPLVGLAADEAVELVEALVGRPAVEGAGDARSPRRPSRATCRRPPCCSR